MVPDDGRALPYDGILCDELWRERYEMAFTLLLFDGSAYVCQGCRRFYPRLSANYLLECGHLLASAALIAQRTPLNWCHASAATHVAVDGYKITVLKSGIPTFFCASGL